MHKSLFFLMRFVDWLDMSRQKRSKVWEFFTEAEDSRLAICAICLKEIPRGGDNTKVYTSNLVYHLKSKHLKEYKSMKICVPMSNKDHRQKERQ